MDTLFIFNKKAKIKFNIRRTSSESRLVTVSFTGGQRGYLVFLLHNTALFEAQNKTKTLLRGHFRNMHVKVMKIFHYCHDDLINE